MRQAGGFFVQKKNEWLNEFHCGDVVKVKLRDRAAPLAIRFEYQHADSCYWYLINENSKFIVKEPFVDVESIELL